MNEINELQRKLEAVSPTVGKYQTRIRGLAVVAHRTRFEDGQIEFTSLALVEKPPDPDCKITSGTCPRCHAWIRWSRWSRFWHRLFCWRRQ